MNEILIVAIKSLLYALLITSSCPHVQSTSYKVDVAIHYQLLCTHSRIILIEQAIPAWRKLSAIMNLEIVPYGNSRTIITNNQTVPPEVRFECQHGKRQCDGNILMSCALATLPKEYGFAYIECIYKHEFWYKPSISAPECADKLNLDWEFLSTCGNSAYGRAIQWQMGRKLHRLRPRYTIIPWILVENKHSKEQDKQAFDNMMQLVCDRYRGLKPSVCNETELEEVIPSQIGFTPRNISRYNGSTDDEEIHVHGLTPPKKSKHEHHSHNISHSSTNLSVDANNVTIAKVDTHLLTANTMLQINASTLDTKTNHEHSKSSNPIALSQPIKADISSKEIPITENHDHHVHHVHHVSETVTETESPDHKTSHKEAEPLKLTDRRTTTLNLVDVNQQLLTTPFTLLTTESHRSPTNENQLHSDQSVHLNEIKTGIFDAQPVSTDDSPHQVLAHHSPPIRATNTSKSNNSKLVAEEEEEEEEEDDEEIEVSKPVRRHHKTAQSCA